MTSDTTLAKRQADDVPDFEDGGPRSARIPTSPMAEQHRKMAEPDSAND